MTINTEALAERLGPSKKQIKRQQKFDTVYQWVAGIIDDGHFEQRSVPAGLVVGDNFVACISRERKRYDVVEVSNMLIVIRATDGYTVTLLKYNPNAVNSAGRRPKQKQIYELNEDNLCEDCRDDC
jgi:hypothetical protein